MFHLKKFLLILLVLSHMNVLKIMEIDMIFILGLNLLMLGQNGIFFKFFYFKSVNYCFNLIFYIIGSLNLVFINYRDSGKYIFFFFFQCVFNCFYMNRELDFYLTYKQVKDKFLFFLQNVILFLIILRGYKINIYFRMLIIIFLNIFSMFDIIF